MRILKRKWTLVSILILLPVGFYTKFYSGPLSFWVNTSLGGLFYVMFWSLVIFLVRPTLTPLKIGGLVLVLTCGLEFLQLWHPKFLESIRRYFIGRTLLGTTFAWMDFIHYFIGCLLSVGLLNHLNKIEFQDKSGRNV
ncbi:MAG: DUF2809 domain-containing protein [Desulfobacterales bacterium]